MKGKSIRLLWLFLFLSLVSTETLMARSKNNKTLLLTLQTDKRIYRDNDRIQIKLIFENIGKLPIQIYLPIYRHEEQLLRFQRTDGTTISVMEPKDYAVNQHSFDTINAGQQYQSTITGVLKKNVLDFGTNSFNLENLNEIQISAEFRSNRQIDHIFTKRCAEQIKKYDPKVSIWQGQVTAKPVVIKIMRDDRRVASAAKGIPMKGIIDNRQFLARHAKHIKNGFSLANLNFGSNAGTWITEYYEIDFDKPSFFCERQYGSRDSLGKTTMRAYKLSVKDRARLIELSAIFEKNEGPPPLFESIVVAYCSYKDGEIITNFMWDAHLQSQGILTTDLTNFLHELAAKKVSVNDMIPL